MFPKLIALGATVLVVAGVTFTGAASPALAAGSDSPVPYTVSASGIQLPAGSTLSANGNNDGNVKIIARSDYRIGQTYKNTAAWSSIQSINFHLEGKVGFGLGMEGKSVLPFDEALSDGAFRGTLPSTDYCIVWVQVGGFNEHFGEGGQTPVCTTPPPKGCVSSPTFSYTFASGPSNADTASGTITASAAGAKKGDPLCRPLFVRAATWSFAQPNALWPQSLVGADDTTVDAIGTFGYTAPVVHSCKQNDIYASFTGFDELALPAQLNGPGTPWEPDFLHGQLPGAGPVPTFYSDTATGCSTAIPDPEPVGFADVCGIAGDQVNLPALAGAEGYRYTTDDQRDADGVGAVTITAVADSGHDFAAGAVTRWQHVFRSDADNDCLVTGDPSATPQVCDFNLGGFLPGSVTVAEVKGVQYTIHPVGADSSRDVVVISGGTPEQPGVYTVTASAIAGSGAVLTGVTEWTLTVAPETRPCDLVTHAVVTPAVTPIDPVCALGAAATGLSGTGLPGAGLRASGLLSIDLNDGIDYYVGGTKLTADRTAFAPGTYRVTAVAQPGNVLDPASPSTFDVAISSAAAVCGDLETLAFTGTAPALAGIVGTALLLFGASVLILARRRRASRHAL